jgi:hypothetical protein
MQVLRSELPSYQGTMGAPAPNTVGAFDEPIDGGQVQKQLHNQIKCPGPAPRFEKCHDCNPRKDELGGQQQSVQSIQSIRVEAEGSLLKPALKREESAGRESRSVRVHWYANEGEPNRTSEGTTQTSPTSATGLQRKREQGSAESEQNAEKHEMPPRIPPEEAFCKSREAPTNVERVETATQTSSVDKTKELVDKHKKEEEPVRPLEEEVGARETQSTKKKVVFWRGDWQEVFASPEKAVAGGRREEASGVDIPKESTCRGASLTNDQAQHRRRETDPLSRGVIIKSVGKARVMRAWK